jgi:hypothetical protein
MSRPYSGVSNLFQPGTPAFRRLSSCDKLVSFADARPWRRQGFWGAPATGHEPNAARTGFARGFGPLLRE